MRPLRGKTVVVTRPPHQAHLLVSALEQAGVRTLRLPVIGVAPVTDTSALDESLRAFARGRYEVIVFTSANAVDAVTRGLDRLGLDFYREAARVAVGPATARRLEDAGLAPSVVPDTFTGAAAAAALGPGRGDLLLPQADDARPATRRALHDLGWSVEAVTAYRTVPGSPDATALAQVKRGDFDAITFTSSSALRHFVELVGDPVAVGLGPDGKGSVVCMGASACEAATEAGLLVAATATQNTIGSLVDAVVDCLT